MTSVMDIVAFVMVGFDHLHHFKRYTNELNWIKHNKHKTSDPDLCDVM